MADRLQTRLEQTNLHRIGYVGKRLHEIAVEYAGFLGGRTAERWLREVAVELIRQADRISAQSDLFTDPDADPGDPIIEQIMTAPNKPQIDRIRRAYPDRWSDVHEVARHRRIAELAARW